MKGLSLICFLSACALVAEGCGGGAATGGTGGSGGGAGTGAGTGGTGGSAGTGGSGTGGSAGTGGSGTAGKGGAGGANGGASGTAGSSCPMQSVTGNACRSPADCDPNVNEQKNYYCEINPGGTSGCATPNCATTPVHDCTVDTDCPTNDICITVPIACCAQTSTVCHLSCNAPGVGCGAGNVCSPGTKGADDYGCAPQLCNAGYTCATGYVCQVGSTMADGHGCLALPCSQTGCPSNFSCTTTATVGGCSPKRCSTDCDCDSGFCVGGSCSSVLGTCVRAPV